MKLFYGPNSYVGKYKAGIFYPWLLEQDKIWIDESGTEHLIEEMPKDYLLNVLLYLYESHRYRIKDPYTCPLINVLREGILDEKQA